MITFNSGMIAVILMLMMMIMLMVMVMMTTKIPKMRMRMRRMVTMIPSMMASKNPTQARTYPQRTPQLPSL